MTTLWIMAILSLLAMGIGFRASLEARLARYNMNRLEARCLAKAALAKTEKYLRNDKKNYDTLYECGISFGEDETPESVFSAEFNKLGEGVFSARYEAEREVEDEEGVVTTVMHKYYGGQDEERKININMSKLSPNNKTEYRRIMRLLLPEPGEDITKDELIEAILDWQDSDSAGLTEEAYYHGLEHPYECKNADFEFIEELSMVKGMTGAIFNEIKDCITVYGNGKININTASKKVLHAIIEDVNIVDDFIIKYRSGQDRLDGTKDDRGFSALGQIGFIPEARRGYFIFESEIFTINSYGSVRGTGNAIRCVVKKKPGKDENPLLYYHEH